MISEDFRTPEDSVSHVTHIELESTVAVLNGVPHVLLDTPAPWTGRWGFHAATSLKRNRPDLNKKGSRND